MLASRLLLMSFFALAGCATQAQQESDRIKTTVGQAKSEMTACRTREEAMPAYQALKDNLPPLDGSAPSMTLQANKAKPTLEDVPMLIEFHRDGITPCRKITLEEAAKVNTALASPIAESYAASDQNFVRLVRREISWGDFATANYQRTVALQSQLRNVGSKIDERLANAHAQELQRRQAAWAAAAAAVRASQPVTTNCQRIGSSINCTSY
jgi:hypothetical protein